MPSRFRRLPWTAFAASVGAVAAVLGLLVGCWLSDYVALSGFPHSVYRVAVALDRGSRLADDCAQLSAPYGPVLAAKTTGELSTCELVVTGDLLRDGSMLWYPGHLTWYGRVVQSFAPVRIPGAKLLSVQREGML